MLKLSLIFVFLFAFVVDETEVDAKKRKRVSRTKRSRKVPSKLDKTRENISEGIRSFSTGIDKFFSSEESEEESNKSHIKFTNQNTFEQYEKADIDFRLTGRLSLPRTEEKLQLIVESDDESNTDSDQANLANPNQDTESTTTTAGLRYLFDSQYGFNWSLDGGVRINDGVDPFIRTRVRKSWFSKKWEYRFIETLELVESTGLTAKTEVIFDRPFYHAFLFRQYNALRWREDEDSMTWYHNYNVIHKFRKRQAISYQIGVQGRNVPQWFAETYHASVSFRALIYKDWVYMTFRPGLVYRKEDEFRQRRQLMILFDVFFGDP